MGWTVQSGVTAAMQMAATQLLDTVAASQDGQVKWTLMGNNKTISKVL